MSNSVRTVRLSDLVKHFGPAHLVTLWSDPKTDKHFMRAVEENRVITIMLQHAGTRKDFGVVGFNPKPSATYIVFSKPLSVASGTKVVGVKYDLIEEAPVKDPVPQSSSQPAPKVHQRTTRSDEAGFGSADTDKNIVTFPEQTPPQKFRVTLSVTTKSRVEKEIKATNAKEACAKALQDVRKEPVDLTDATITRRVISAKKA
jgi:hypothetical protein